MHPSQGIASVANQQRILFDHKWYSATYMANTSGMANPANSVGNARAGGPVKSGEALRHFLEVGRLAGHNPHPLFFTAYYLSQLPSTETPPENPLRHYIETGAALGMNPCPLFDPKWYSERYNVAETGLAPLAHYIRNGVPEHLDPNGYFDAAAYEAEHAEAIRGYAYALLHYLFTAEKGLQNPSSRFCTKDYLELNPDAARDRLNPLRHYLERGQGQLRHVRWPVIDYGRLAPPYRLTPSELSVPEQEGIPAPDCSKRIVIFTALTGNYSRLLPPTALTPDSRFICYSDTERESWGVWELRRAPYRNDDKRRMARYVKTHPHQLFPAAEWAVWCDANIIINGDLSGFIEQVRENGAPIGLMPHPWRDCLYEEAETCLITGKDSPRLIREQVERYRNEGCPEKAGLMASGFFVANLRHPQTGPLLETWWGEMERHSGRDQISLPFAMHRLGVRHFYMTARHESIWNDPRLIYLVHQATWNVKVPDRLRTLRD